MTSVYRIKNNLNTKKNFFNLKNIYLIKDRKVVLKDFNGLISKNTIEYKYRENYTVIYIIYVQYNTKYEVEKLLFLFLMFSSKVLIARNSNSVSIIVQIIIYNTC